MWYRRKSIIQRLRRFFSIAFGEGELFNIYQTNFTLMDRFGYDVSFFEGMIPYEREIYLSLLINKLDKDAQKT